MASPAGRGATPSAACRPGRRRAGSTEEAAAVLRAAAATTCAVVVRGAGTKLDWGAPPRRLDLIVDTARLTGVVEHAAGDLITVVRAGTPLAEPADAAGRPAARAGRAAARRDRRRHGRGQRQRARGGCSTAPPATC